MNCKAFFCNFASSLLLVCLFMGSQRLAASPSLLQQDGFCSSSKTDSIPTPISFQIKDNIVFMTVSCERDVDLGPITAAFSNTVKSVVGEYQEYIFRSADTDPLTGLPYFWIWGVQLNNKIINEFHVGNMIVYQGDRSLLNSIPRGEEWHMMWQICGF